MDDILTAIKEIQFTKRLTDETFAESIGYSRIQWSRIKNGKVPINDKFIAKAIRAYTEELKKYTENFLSNKATQYNTVMRSAS